MEESTPYNTTKAGFHGSPVPKRPKELQQRKGSHSNNNHQ